LFPEKFPASVSPLLENALVIKTGLTFLRGILWAKGFCKGRFNKGVLAANAKVFWPFGIFWQEDW